MTFQAFLKKLLLKPYGPGDFIEGMDQMASLISRSEKEAMSENCCSTAEQP